MNHGGTEDTEQSHATADCEYCNTTFTILKRIQWMTDNMPNLTPVTFQ